MRKSATICALMGLLLVCVNPSWGSPTVLLSDDFNTENGGANGTPYAGFANWDVSDGSVDLIGKPPWELFPAYGMYVDMDGSTLDAGKLTTKTVFNFQPGITYELTYELAGSQRSNYGDDSVTVRIGPVEVATHTLHWDAPFTKYTWPFMINFPATISFEGIGGDYVGLLLDNVNLTAIPAPGAILLSTVGVSFVGWLRRRKTI